MCLQRGRAVRIQNHIWGEERSLTKDDILGDQRCGLLTGVELLDVAAVGRFQEL